MRHLVKFNENKDHTKWNDEDIEYFNNCFIEFIDNGTLSIENYQNYCLFSISLPEQSNEKISDFIKISEDRLEFYKEIENCIEKIKLEYSDIDIKLSLQADQHKIRNRDVIDIDLYLFIYLK